MMSDVAQTAPGFELLEKRMAIADAVKVIAAQNPKFAQAIVLQEYYDLSVAEIAQKLNDTERNIYYYLDQAKKIGKQYKCGND